MAKINMTVTASTVAQVARKGDTQRQISVHGLPEHSSGLDRSRNNCSMITFESAKHGVIELFCKSSNSITSDGREGFDQVYDFLSSPKNVGKTLTVEAQIQDDASGVMGTEDVF